jgi:hypothetical protein
MTTLSLNCVMRKCERSWMKGSLAADSASAAARVLSSGTEIEHNASLHLHPIGRENPGFMPHIAWLQCD